MNKNEESKSEFVCRTEKSVLPRGKKSTRILEVSITAPEIISANTKPALNLSMVIDRSGSMSGEKLQYAKQAAAHLVELLGKEDLASVVMYDDSVEVVSPPRKMTDGNKTAVKKEIQEIFSRGSTALFDGWLKGCKKVAENSNDGFLSRTLLLSDGLANVGLTDQDAIASHARELFQRGVSTSCFGIGRDYNEHLLEAISNAGGGEFHFLEALSAIPLAFEREFEELIHISLQDAKIIIQLPTGADCEVSAGWPSVTNGSEVTTTLGSVYAGREQRVYFQLHLPEINEAEKIALSVKFQAVTMEKQAIEFKLTIEWTLVSGEEDEKAEIDKELMERFALVDMADRATEALRMARAGDRVGANYILAQSVGRHRANMPANMQSKYTHMSQSIDEGMDEFDLKRRHQEEYFNKRTRSDNRDYHLLLINGHLFTSIENRQVLIDTGIPVSLGRDPEWYFMHEVHELSEGYLGVTLQQISSLVGAPVDILLGSDILKNYCALFELDRQRFSISAQPMLQSRHNFPLSLLMGVPGVRIDILGQPAEMYLDTGAKLSYVSSAFASGLKAVGKEKDFYPGLGEFETDVYEIDFSLGDLVFTLRCGLLPGMLETALKVSDKQGIIGTEFFTRFGVEMNYPRQILTVRA
jgi:Ca-activated chloride channel family protein